MTQYLNNLNVSAKAATVMQGTLIGSQTTMPPASVYNVGCTVQYTGATGAYTQGRFYTCVQEGAGYQWVESALISTGLDVGTANRAVITDGTGMAVASGVSATELGYLSGVTAGIQGQLNGKVPTSRTVNGKALTDNITLTASDIGAAPASAVLEASRALQSSSNGEVQVSNVTSVELSFLSGVTSAIQTQLNNKANTSAIPTLLSQLTNDTGFITNSVSDLINYYTKDQTYTQSEINSMVSAIPKFSIQVVQSLPSSGISTTTIYLVPKAASTNDSYDEYIYVNNTWERIGSTAVDLSDYYTKAQVNALVTPSQSASGITLNGVSFQTATDSRTGLMTDASGNLTLNLTRGSGAFNVGPVALTAAKAVADGSGNNIASTYATQSALSSGLAGKADAGTEITGGAFSNNTLTLNRDAGDIEIDLSNQQDGLKIGNVMLSDGETIFGLTDVLDRSAATSSRRPQYSLYFNSQTELVRNYVYNNISWNTYSNAESLVFIHPDNITYTSTSAMTTSRITMPLTTNDNIGGILSEGKYTIEWALIYMPVEAYFISEIEVSRDVDTHELKYSTTTKFSNNATGSYYLVSDLSSYTFIFTSKFES